MFFTYIHRKVSDNSVFYVGMGSYSRMMNKSTRPKEWQEMAKDGRNVEIVAQWKTREEAFSHEQLLISCFKDMKHPLVNKTKGGAGNDVPKTKEFKELAKNQMIGNSYRSGIKHTQEARQKMSESKAGKPHKPYICLDCGKVTGGNSNMIQHQKASNCVGKTLI